MQWVHYSELTGYELAQRSFRDSVTSGLGIAKHQTSKTNFVAGSRDPLRTQQRIIASIPNFATCDSSGLLRVGSLKLMLSGFLVLPVLRIALEQAPGFRGTLFVFGENVLSLRCHQKNTQNCKVIKFLGPSLVDQTGEAKRSIHVDSLWLQVSQS